MAAQLEQLGFVAAHRHPDQDVVRYKQGRINLLLNRSQTGQAAEFRARTARPPTAWPSASTTPRSAIGRGRAGRQAGRRRQGAGRRLLRASRASAGQLLYLVDRHGAGGLYADWTAVPGGGGGGARTASGSTCSTT